MSTIRARSSSPIPRNSLVDALKAVAAQLIVLHHLAFYGPVADVAWPLAPALWSWLADEARWAVQVFLVVGGFLAASALAPDGYLRGSNVVGALRRRYMRLVIPYVVTLALAIFASAVAGRWMTHEAVSPMPTLEQFFAHVFLLQGIMGFEALSAGVWYIAIDFQLFALLLTLLWVAQRIQCLMGWSVHWGRHLALTMIVLMAALSLYYFNRDPSWDDWALYFFGAYALGAGAWWLSRSGVNRIWVFTVMVFALGALTLDWRPRLAVAMVTAWALVLVQRHGAMRVQARWGRWGADVIAALSRTSYALFLVHFPVCLLVNAVIVRFLSPLTPVGALCGVLVAWCASLVSAVVFHQFVERRAVRWVSTPSRWALPSV